jgi:hypothetical protein
MALISLSLINGRGRAETSPAACLQ